MNKWEAISEISKASNRYGDKLVELMEINNAHCLPDITEEQAINYCKEHRIALQERRDEIETHIH